MIAKAAAITKDYLRWAAGAMLVSAVVFFSVSLLVKHPSVFLSSLGAIAATSLTIYYFRRHQAEQPVQLTMACEVTTVPRRIEYDARGNIVREERIVASKTSGFLFRKRTEYQYWVLLYMHYQKPFAEDIVIDEIRAHQFAFRDCGIEHVRLELPNDKHDHIIIACMITDRWQPNNHFDSRQCRNVLTHIAGSYSAFSPVRMIEGPREELQDSTVIEAF